MLMILFFVIFAVSCAYGGTPCPPRGDIYPCSCVSLPKGKKNFYTFVICHKLENTEAFNKIFKTLRQMEIDQFHLYDSFWEADRLGQEDQQKLPSDWITLLRIKELEIIDTKLSSCFACEAKLKCQNGIMTRFTAVNSSSHEKICTLCNLNNDAPKFPWISCLSKLTHFHFSHGMLTKIRTSFFALPLKELRILNMTHNQIVEIEPNAFKNLPRLTKLDLSHNAIQEIGPIFSAQTNLEFVDLSWNAITTLGPNFIRTMPFLKTLNLENNLIGKMSKEEWSKTPTSLRKIFLKNNPLHCDCDVTWVNGTFHINVILEAFCVSPDDYNGSSLRRASRFLIERCDEDGNIGTRPPKVKPTKA